MGSIDEVLDPVRLRVLVAVARTGSLTAAAKELHYAQPSVSHHLARLEAETGAKLLQRVGRGVRLTDAGQLLAERAAEILGRLDSAAAELEALTQLRAGRVRLAAFPSALGTFVPEAGVRLAESYPGVELHITEAEPPEALAMIRAGEADVAVVFGYGPGEDPDVRTRHLFDDPGHLVYLDGPTLGDHRDGQWIAGCERCRRHLLDVCAKEGFTPNITFTTDDYVAVQAMVAAGLGAALLPSLALRAHRDPRVRTAELPGSVRHVYAATYGAPPDPPATQALLEALAKPLA